MRELLGTRVDVDHVNRLGWTALAHAERRGQRAIAEILRRAPGKSVTPG